MNSLFKTAVALLIFILHSFPSKPQNIKDLVFAHPDNTGLLNMGLFPINDDMKFLVGMTSLYLLDRENLFIDTIEFAKSNHWKHYPINITVQKDWQIAITSPSAFWVIGAQAGKLILQENITVDKELKKNTTSGIQYIPVAKDYLVVLEQKTKDYKLYKRTPGGGYRFVHLIAKHRPPVTKYRQGEVISLSQLHIKQNKLYIYKRNTNVIDVYEIGRQDNSSTIIELPALLSNEECNLFYLDYFTGKLYVQNYNGSEKNILYELDEGNGSLTKLLETPYLIRGVFNNKYYVSGIFDGTYGHYLLPLQGANEGIILLDDGN